MPPRPEVWHSEVRPQVLETFATEIYGRPPQDQVFLDWSVLEDGETEGGSWRRQLAVTVTGAAGSHTVMVLITVHYLQTGPDSPGLFERGLMPIFGPTSLEGPG